MVWKAKYITEKDPKTFFRVTSNLDTNRGRTMDENSDKTRKKRKMTGKEMKQPMADRRRQKLFPQAGRHPHNGRRRRRRYIIRNLLKMKSGNFSLYTQKCRLTSH